MCFSIPGVGLFAICYRSIEGVFDLIAFRRVHNGANLQKSPRPARESAQLQSRTYQKTPSIAVFMLVPPFRGQPAKWAMLSAFNFPKRAAFATVLTRLRPASATIVMARPDVMRLIPTISPRCCPGGSARPSLDDQCDEDQISDTTCQHPSPQFGKHVAIAERCHDLKDAFDNEEGNKHQGKRDRAFGRIPEQGDADEQRECRREQGPQKGRHVLRKEHGGEPYDPAEQEQPADIHVYGDGRDLRPDHRPQRRG